MRRELKKALVLRALVLAGAVAAAPCLAAGAAKFGNIDDARLRRADSEPQNWLTYSGNDSAWRFSALDQINVDTVKDLKPAWVLDFDTNRGQEASPIVVDGVAYVSTAWNKVYAVDAKSGAQIWKWEPGNRAEKGAMACCDVVNRGVAVYQGKVFVGTIDGRLVALDARTGKQVWSAQTVPLDGMLTITGVPSVANGLVYIGNAGGDKGGRGYVSAYHADSGKLAWRFYLTPGAPGVKDNAASDEIMDKLVQPTWFGPHNEYRGGATVWGHMVYDPEFDQLLLATGNGFPWSRWHRSAGKGDNLFLASVVALDARTGRYKWHYQETPGEEWDLAATADLVLAELPINGKPTKVVMHAPKAGVFFILDRATGKLASGAPFVPGMQWFKGFNPDGTPIVNEAAHYDNKTPARWNSFARNWNPMSWNPRTQLMYLNANQGPPSLNYPTETFEWMQEGTGLGIYTFGMAIPEALRKIEVPMPANAVERRSYLMAWDPVKQAPAWQTDGNGSGVLTTAGNLVFQGFSRGGVMGELKAFRADDGKEVWSYKTPNAVLTSPVSYQIDGEQYLLVPTGAANLIFGGGSDQRARQPGRLVAFKLNGKATLPPDPPPAAPIQAPSAAETWTDSHLFAGSELYARHCSHCHGITTRNNGVIPDLKRSAFLNSAAAWKTVVEDGALKQLGMIGWSHLLPPGGAENIRHFVQNEARKALTAPPTPSGPALSPTEAAIQQGL
jgi:quinohemoprotein ethanol dehydrogenase